MVELVNMYLGQYWLMEVIGRGNTSTVYKAYQPSLNRYVAVKVLRQLDPVSAARFEREAQAIALLRHPNILPIFDYGEHDGQRYFVLQYVENGRTLGDLMRANPLEPVPALRLIGHVLAALDHAHGNGVLHRDVKPSNILLMSATWPLLADFGIAKLTDESRALTPPGQAVGTAMYLAPERANGAPADERSDLYSVGVVLFEMLTGRVPFDAQTPMAVLKKHLYEAPPLPRTINPNLPTAAEALVLRALQKRPDARYQRAADMAADVSLVIADLEQRQGRPGTAVLPSKAYTTRKFGPRPPLGAQPVHAAASLQAQPAARSGWSRRRVALMAALTCFTLIAGLLAYRRLPPGARVASGAERGAATTTALPHREASGKSSFPATTTPAGNSLASPSVVPAAQFFGSEPGAEASFPPGDEAVPTPGELIPTPVPPSPTATLVPPTQEPPQAPPPPPPPQPAPPSPIPPTPTAVVPTATEPSLPPEPTPVLADALAPAASALQSAAVRIDDGDWRGGYGGADRTRSYGGRSAVWIYGTGTSYNSMRAVFTLPAAPTGTAFLEIEGMDSEDRKKTPISIRINGTEIYAGPSLLPDDDLPLESGTWDRVRWSFDAVLLAAGPNEIEIRNLAPGSVGLPPFFMLDYATVIYQLPQ